MTRGLDQIRGDFPFLQRRVNGRPIIYFDNAATAQKPSVVIDSVCEFYANHCANIHRGAHLLSQEASERYEEARDAVSTFLGCEPREVVFVRGATEAINMVSRGLPEATDVLLPESEHHSNLLPWRERHRVRLARVDAEGRIDLEELARRLTPEVGLVALSHVGNALGVINPVAEVAALAAANGSLLLVDASQSAGHLPVDVGALGCDFLAFSGPKVMGPFGVGVLYGRAGLLERLRPGYAGGGSVKEVDREGSVPNDVPWRLEAGTPNIEGAIGLAAALGYVERLGLDWIAAHDRRIVGHALDRLSDVPGCRVLGPAGGVEARCASVAFTLRGVASQVVARVLSERSNVMTRAGLHCAHPLHAALGIGPTVRASFGVYNTEEEVDRMAAALAEIARLA